ncbi:protein-disulfide reductase DsbD family protein [Marilutibacter spongiae]|uniref:Protein-disulfide reductase DsbD n=1 Tax=Marilutibacter spongiae TaxID=2025720 RepID=A0A7W3Y719_9GAMM|nr:protein-disulfide reductase DsbD [Lysobacter spongiae]MBB1061709.1 protein-disulfide reductase DsbD [Lysobacter spongiae]
MTDILRNARERFARALPALAPAALVLLVAAAAFPAAAAVDLDDLLPVDDAFALSAEATAPDTITLRWKIADGYYLYRHRTSVQADAAFGQQVLQLPKGHAYTDEFFGDVETYRGTLTAVLPGRAGAGTVSLKVKYQGCADLGICYPPQTRALSVAMPAAGGAGTDPAPASGALRLPGGTAGGMSNASPGNPLLAPSALPGGQARPLPAEQAFGVALENSDGDVLRVRFDVAPGYYLYRDKTAFELRTPGVRAGAPRWPAGQSHHDEHFGTTTVFFDPVTAAVPLLRSSADAAAGTLEVEFQGCQTGGICYPLMHRSLAVALPVGAVTAPTRDAVGAGRGDDAAAAPAPLPAAPSPDGKAGADPGTAAPMADPSAVREMPPASAATPAIETAPRRPRSGLGLFSALLLAIGGGLILNLMPCVLPVLSLKALSLAGSGESPGKARRHALWYTAGVLASFVALGALALGLRQAGLALGWGFQLQQPLVVALLGLLMFVLGLSLSGVWHVGGRWTGVGHGLATRSGAMGDFFTGVLAVVVATPCTAPLMGPALAWAFTAGSTSALLVFLALGLGLALPFLLIGFVPGLAHRLPRPGAWMDTFKQALAFPLYLTAVWLAWVLARQRGADAIGWWLLAATLLAFAAWAWTRARRNGGRGGMVLAAVALLATLWPLHAIHTLPRPRDAAVLASPTHDALAPVPFSEQRLADLRAAGRPVFVNMTADWCVTCKANDKAVFAREGFRDALEAANAVYMLGDWTDVDPALTAFLQRYEAVGVPLYVVFPADGGEGRVLPTVLTPDLARQALEQAAAP